MSEQRSESSRTPARPERPQRPPGTIKVGTIAGSDVLVTTSWFVIAALIAWVVAPRVDQVSPGLGGLKYVAGFAFAVVSYFAPHAVSAALSGVAGAVAVISLRASNWTRRAIQTVAMS